MAGLSVKELYSLMGFFSDEENQTFEFLGSTFHNMFGKTDHLRVGLGLVALLREPDMLPRSSQRLVTLYLLFEMYRSDGIMNNPFLSVFYQLLNPNSEVDEYSVRIGEWPKLSKQERLLLMLLISNQQNQVVKKTPKQFLTTENHAGLNSDLGYLQTCVDDLMADIPDAWKYVKPINLFPFPDQHASKEISYTEQQAVLNTAEHMLTDEEGGNIPPGYRIPRLPFERLKPPLHQGEDEYVWMNPTDIAEFLPLFDTTVGQDLSGGGSEASTKSKGKNEKGDVTPELQKTVQKAFQAALQSDQTTQLIKEIKSDDSFLEKSGITSEKLADLVENNPTVAVEVILAIIRSDKSSMVSEYMGALVNMELSLHSMEVVNRLTSTIDLPKEFLHVYITNCVSTCENLKDKYHQQRMEIGVELQAFCIEFSRIKEAAGLFRLVKSSSGGVDGDVDIKDDA